MPSPRIGNTPLDPSIPCSGRCHGAKVYIKAEDKNHFGTFKDRRCAALLDHHSGRRDVVFVQITSGNSGYSLGRLVEEEKERRKREDPDDKRVLAVVNLVPKGTSPAIIQKLSECSFVKEIDTTDRIISFERMRKIARELAHYEGEERYIVGVEDYRLPDGYRKIVREINEDGVRPTHIFCPVGEGELITELAAEAQLVWGREAPKIIGVTVPENVLTKKGSFLRKLGKSVADKLVNGYSKFKEFVMDYVRIGRVELTIVSEAQIAREYTYLNGIGISAEPSAAAAFAGARLYALKPSDTVVIINTGKGIYDQKAVDKVWMRRLKKLAGYVAAAVVGAALLLGGNFAYQRWQEYKQERVIIQEENEYHWMQKKLEWAMMAGKGRLDSISQEDVRAACRLLGKPEDVCKTFTFSQFTPEEIELLIKISKKDVEAACRMLGEPEAMCRKFSFMSFTPEDIEFLNRVYNLSDSWAVRERTRLILEYRANHPH